MTVQQLPALNATLNSIATCLLIAGFVFIKRGHREWHMRAMVGALIVSAAFMCSYLYYHAQVGSNPYPLHDWTRPLYFAILIPHIILAGLVAPFIVALVWFAWRRQFDRHRRLARFVWPVWIYVSISGVAVYWLLYRYAGVA